MGMNTIQIATYKLYSMAFGSQGPVNILDMTTGQVSGHGTLEMRLRLSAHDASGKPSDGALDYRRSGSSMTYRFEFPVPHSFFDHAYQLCANERPLRCVLGYQGDTIQPFAADEEERQRRVVNWLRFETGDEPIGEGVEDIDRVLAELMS